MPNFSLAENTGLLILNNIFIGTQYGIITLPGAIEDVITF
jgi:hypothetical protein